MKPLTYTTVKQRRINETRKRKRKENRYDIYNNSIESISLIQHNISCQHVHCLYQTEGERVQGIGVCVRACVKKKKREREGDRRRDQSENEKSEEGKIGKDLHGSKMARLKLCINIFINTNYIKMYRTSLEKKKE